VEELEMHRFALVALSAAVLFVAQTTTGAEIQTQIVDYTHDGQQLRGYLAWDNSVEGQRPGVLVVHEWWGLNDYARRRAEELAGLGYIAFAPDMYGEGKTTEHPEEAGQWAGQVRENVEEWRGRGIAGLNVLREHKLVDGDRIAAIGYCFGGATVLQLAYAGEPLRGVVTFHGALPIPSESEAESIRARILICHGAADSFIPEATAQELRDILGRSNVDWQMIYYGGAKHSFTNPGADEKNVEGLAYDRQADESSWQHMQIFFNQIFRD
jgi:dienelactone hydrolase